MQAHFRLPTLFILKCCLQNGRDIPIERADRTVTAKVTFEISFGTEKIGNITFGLFGRTCPKTVRNFVTLANPNRPTGEGYNGSKIHRIVRGFAFQGRSTTILLRVMASQE